LAHWATVDRLFRAASPAPFAAIAVIDPACPKKAFTR
jgi:hypothetical protein